MAVSDPPKSQSDKRTQHEIRRQAGIHDPPSTENVWKSGYTADVAGASHDRARWVDLDTANAPIILLAEGGQITVVTEAHGKHIQFTADSRPEIVCQNCGNWQRVPDTLERCTLCSHHQWRRLVKKY